MLQGPVLQGPVLQGPVLQGCALEAGERVGVDVGRDHLGALGGEGERSRPPDPLTGGGDECFLAGEPCHGRDASLIPRSVDNDP